MLRSLSLLAIFTLASLGPAQETKIAATPVKYDGLKQEILKQRGKVVVVDFWSTNCPPCMKAFPDFIEMQKKYADKGLVIITVAVYPEGADDDTQELANKFLTRVKSPLRNFIFTEPSDVWGPKLNYEGLPFYYLFDRHGKWHRFRAADAKDGKVDYAELERVVVRMLNEK